MRGLNDRNKRATASEGISRREALKKTGRYAALTTFTLMTVLAPKARAEVSPPNPPDDQDDIWGSSSWGNGDSDKAMDENW